MPKNDADPKLDRANNRADSKDNQQNNDHFTEEAQTLTNNKAADIVPSLNNISKNES